jgi:hypothetical protein
MRSTRYRAGGLIRTVTLFAAGPIERDSAIAFGRVEVAIRRTATETVAGTPIRSIVRVPLSGFH